MGSYRRTHRRRHPGEGGSDERLQGLERRARRLGWIVSWGDCDRPTYLAFLEELVQTHTPRRETGVRVCADNHFAQGLDILVDARAPFEDVYWCLTHPESIP